MRKKKSFKKIQLSRETLRNLDGQNLDAVVGGVTAGTFCVTKDPTVCNINSGCFSCDDTCNGCTRTCPP